MALTDRSDIYVAIHESGANRFIQHVMRQRPSLFNYGTSITLQRPKMRCEVIDFHPVVVERGNPVISVQPPAPVLGTPFGVDFIVQVTGARLDFFPENTLSLPPGLTTLRSQRFALNGTICGGLACPGREVVDRLPLPSRGKPSALTDFPSNRGRDEFRPPRLDIFSDTLNCACLDVFGIGDIDFVGIPIAPRLTGRCDDLELVDIAPVQLENILECYAKMVVQLAVLPRLADLPALRFSQAIVGLANATVMPAATTAALPNNPAIEDDQLKVFVDAAIEPPSVPFEIGELPPLPIVGTEQQRTRTGPFDAIIAVSEAVSRELFTVVRNSFAPSTSGELPFGPFSVSWAFGARLSGGTLDFRDDGTIRLSELDVIWDPVEVCFAVNIDPICVGGFCIIPDLIFGGCALEAPEVCFFGDEPDLEFCLDLGGLLTSELTATLRPLLKHAIHPSRTSAMNDWDAHDAGIPNKWQVHIDPSEIDLDAIDVADTVGNILDAAIEAAVNDALGDLPDWARDLILAILGPVVDAVRAILDIGDDVQEWLSDFLGVSLSFLSFVTEFFGDIFYAFVPLMELEDPFPVLDDEDETGLIPILLPLQYIEVGVNTSELVISGDIGD
jgi:hypothetical protein